ncbi:hypothetical protein Tco_0204821 [Tanacetum coccineum]
MEVGRCNNYAVFLNISCPREYRIVGQLLVDHALSYALTATADVPAMYLQQFWKTVKHVPNANETIHFMVDKKEITYTVDMFLSTLKLPVETPEQPFIPPATLKFIQLFLKIVGYQGLVDKVSAFYMKNLTQPWQTMFKVFNICLTSRTSGHDQTKYPGFTKLIIANIMAKFESIPKILKEEYHSIKDDTSLAYKECVENYGWVEVLMIQPELKPISTPIPPPSDDKERDEIHEATLLSLALHKTAKIVENHVNLVAVKEKILEEDVDKIIEGEYEESYASKFANSIFLDEEDFDTRIEPGSHKENLEKVVDDDEEKKDNKKDDDDDENDDHDDHALIKTQRMGSSEIGNEKMQTPIPSPPRSPRKDTSLDKTITQELTEKADVVLHDIVPKISSNATNDLIDDNIPRIAANNTVLNVHSTTSASIATTTTSDLQHQLYLKMKTDLQAQVVDLELWDVLRAKFEKSSASAGLCRTDTFCNRDHDDHQGDDAPPKGEKHVKRQKISKGLKSASGSLSKQSTKQSASKKQPQQEDWDAWVDTPICDENEVSPPRTPGHLFKEYVLSLPVSPPRTPGQ